MIARPVALLLLVVTVVAGQAAAPTGAQPKHYTIRTFTGDKSGAGTDANVYITLYGEKGDSERLQLKKSATSGLNKFEQNRTDTFDVTTPTDLGRLKKIVIEQDNSGVA